jgi:hypothetical protein
MTLWWCTLRGPKHVGVCFRVLNLNVFYVVVSFIRTTTYIMCISRTLWRLLKDARWKSKDVSIFGSMCNIPNTTGNSLHRTHQLISTEYRALINYEPNTPWSYLHRHASQPTLKHKVLNNINSVPLKQRITSLLNNKVCDISAFHLPKLPRKGWNWSGFLWHGNVSGWCPGDEDYTAETGLN